MPQGVSGIRSAMAPIAVLGAFALGLFFWGVDTNFAILVAAAALLLVGVSGVRHIAALAVAAPSAFAFAVVALAVLVLNVQLSVSKEESFAPAFVLAALPLTFLAAASMSAPQRRLLERGVWVIVVGLAMISLARLLLFGERARLPLVDPNSYATLMYLVWIPFVHVQLERQWRGVPSMGLRRGVEYACSSLLVLAIFATHSRAGFVIVMTAFAVWLGVAVVKRLALRGVALHGALAIAAFGVVLLVSPSNLVAQRMATVAPGIGVRTELIDSALTMFRDHPLSGIGVFCFNTLYGATRPISEQLTAGVFVHNDYVQFLAEGGVQLALVLIALAAATTWFVVRGLRAAVSSADFHRLGPALAVGAACAHAMVNFVFYTLPLLILIGVLGAMMIQPTANTAEPRSRLHWRGVAAGVAFGWIAWLFLTLDFVSLGVLRGQGGMPFAGAIRNDPAAQLRYARFAETVNPDRSGPVLAEAVLMARGAGQADAAPDLANRALVAFRHAIELNPWNPAAYVSFADFLTRWPASNQLALRDDETPQALLYKALAFDPVNSAAIDRLLILQRDAGRPDESYALLKNVVFPWLERLKRRDATAADRYIEFLRQLASRAGDRTFLEALAEKSRDLQRVEPAQHPRWFASSSGGSRRHVAR